MEDYKIIYEGFDKSKTSGTYTRLHYGDLRINKIWHPFVVHEVFMADSNRFSFTMLFTTDLRPNNEKEFERVIIEDAKERLNLHKTKIK